MNRPLVYISHAISKGDSFAHVHKACLWWELLRQEAAVLPHTPHWSAQQQMIYPLSWEEWVDYDLELIRRGTFDAIFRPHPDTPSVGADRECQAALDAGIPVFTDKDELYEWSQSWGKETA